MGDQAEHWVAVGRIVTERMKERALGQAELARRAGMSAPTVRGLMLGDPRGRPSVRTLRKISMALGGPIDLLEDALEHGTEASVGSARPFAGDGPADVAARLAALEATTERLLDQIAAMSALQVRLVDELLGQEGSDDADTRRALAVRTDRTTHIRDTPDRPAQLASHRHR